MNLGTGSGEHTPPLTDGSAAGVEPGTAAVLRFFGVVDLSFFFLYLFWNDPPGSYVYGT